MPKTATKTRSTTATKKSQPPAKAPEPQKSSAGTVDNEWHFKVTGRGTSGWMSWVCEGDGEDMHWVQLRASKTSFISAVAAIEPELMRLAFPHRATQKKAI